MRNITLFLSLVFLTGCGVTIKTKMYKDAPSISEQKKKPLLTELPTSRARLKVSSYRLQLDSDEFLDNSTYLRPTFRGGALRDILDLWHGSRRKYHTNDEIRKNLQTLNLISIEAAKEYKKHKGYTSFMHSSRRYNESLNEYLEYYKSNKNDITIIELKIVGLSTGNETIAVKKFNGIVSRFNWAELFKARVPFDENGYLMKGEISVNYANVFDDDSRELFYVFPIKFVENTALPSYESQYLFGPHAYIPFLGVEYKNGYWIKSNKYQEREMYATFYKYEKINVLNKEFKYSYYMNPIFMTHNNMIKTKAAIELERKERRARDKIYKEYKDEKNLDLISTDMNTISLNLISFSSCKNRLRNANGSANMFWEHSTKEKYEDYEDKSREQRFDEEKLAGYVDFYNNNKKKFESLLSDSGTIAVQQKTLDKFFNLSRKILEKIEERTLECNKTGEAVSRIIHARSSSGYSSSSSGPILQNMKLEMPAARQFKKNNKMMRSYSTPSKNNVFVTPEITTKKYSKGNKNSHSKENHKSKPAERKNNNPGLMQHVCGSSDIEVCRKSCAEMKEKFPDHIVSGAGCGNGKRTIGGPVRGL